MPKLRKRGFIISCVIIVLAALSAAYWVLKITADHNTNRTIRENSATASDSRFSVADRFSFIGGDYIAKIYIEGVITTETRQYNQSYLLKTVSDLENDSKNRGILLYLNTPGGGVYQADELYLALIHYKHVTGRPVYAYMGPMAASAGYYLACSADKIMANRNTLTGSIGVIFGSSIDATELMKKIGIKSTTFHSGKNKNMLNIDEPLTAEQREIMQSVADEAYQQFVDIVAQSRSMEKSEVKKLADGRIYTANQAQKNGLIDIICSESQAEDNIISRAKDGESVKIKVFRYEKKDTLSNLLSGAVSGVLKNGLKAATEDAALPALSSIYEP